VNENANPWLDADIYIAGYEMATSEDNLRSYASY